MPEYHSIDEVDKVKRGLDSLLQYNNEGFLLKELKRDYTDNEKRWIRNERILCACDANYWLTRYAYIKDEQNAIHRFSLRDPQKVYFNVIAEMERRGSSIELQILKARQLGISSITELLVTHRICFTSGVNALISSADQQKTQIMSQMLFLAYDRMPFWLKPVHTNRSGSDRGRMIFGGIDSGVSFQHGSQQSGIGRGTTPTVCHLSECASFSNPEEQIEKSLFKAIHPSPSVFFVLESTAEGPTGWWADTWRFSRNNWDKPDSVARLFPLFLPWFIGTDLYPNPTYLSMHPLSDTWKPNRDTQEMMAKARMFVKSQSILWDVLGEDYQVPREQAWWWQNEHEEAKAKGMEKGFYQEYASDDISAFQSGYDSVFGRDLIAEINTERKKEYKVYGIVGPAIEDQHRPYQEDIDYDKEMLFVRYKGNKENSYTWKFLPLKAEDIDEENYETVDNKLLVFHEPKPGIDYCIGIDTGYGKGQDSTAIEVWAMGKGGVPDIQVAEYASAYVSHLEIYPFAIAIAAYYSKYMEAPHKEPLISPEMLAAVGDAMILQMRNMGYSRFFRFTRWDKKKLSKKNATQIGFMSTGWSRPVLTENFVHSAKNKIAEIHSPFLLHEMDNYEVHNTKTGREKMEHSKDTHDDRIIASALALLTYHEMHPMIERGQHRYIPPAHAKPRIQNIDLGAPRGDQYLGDEYFERQVRTPTQLEDYISNERFRY